MAEQLINTPFGKFFAAEKDLIATHLATHGAHNISDLQTFLSVIRPGDTVVDIGAHIGTYAVAAARAVGPGGSVTAFECYRPTFELLRRNIDANNALVKAVFGVVDDIERSYSVETEEGNTGATRFEAGAEGGAKMPVITNIRAHIGSRVDVMKIDVEGMEANVVNAVSRVLRADRPVIMIEISRVELASRGRSCERLGARLKSMGYRFFLNASQRTRKSDRLNLIEIPGLWACGEQVDVLCVHEDSDRFPAKARRGLGACAPLLLNYGYFRARCVALAKRYMPADAYNSLRGLARGKILKAA